MQRRTLMKTAAAGIGTATLGGAGLIASTGGGAAAGGDISLTDASVSDDAGEVSYITLGYWKRLGWTGFDTPATHVELKNDLTVTLPDGSPVSKTLYENTDPVPIQPAAVGDFYGDADYSTGEGTSGALTFGIGDGFKDPVEDGGEYLYEGYDANNVAEQDPSSRWVVVEGSQYDASTDPEYGVPGGEGIQDDGDLTDDDGEPVTLDNTDDGTAEELTFNYEVTFRLYHENENGSFSQLTAGDVGDPENLPESEADDDTDDDAPYIDHPVLDATFTTSVENIESGTEEEEGDGDTTAE